MTMSGPMGLRCLGDLLDQNQEPGLSSGAPGVGRAVVSSPKISETAWCGGSELAELLADVAVVAE
jgi:hypothetical protein